MATARSDHSSSETANDKPAKAAPTTPSVVDEAQRRRSDRKHLRKLQRARQARVIKAAALALIAIALITLVIQNARPVGVRLLFWTQSVRLIWVIIGSALLGAVAGYLVARPDKNIRLHPPERPTEPERPEEDVVPT